MLVKKVIYIKRCWKVPATLKSLRYSRPFLITQAMLVQQVSKRRANISRIFVDKVLSMLQSSISRVLGKAMRIYKTDCDTKIIKTILRLSRTILRLSKTVLILFRTMLRLSKTILRLLVAPGRDCTRKTETVDQESKDRNRALLEILQTITVL